MNDIQRFERIYAAAGRELRRMLLTLDPTTYTDAKAAEVRREAADLVRTLNVAVDRWASEAVPRAYAKGERTARTALEILGKTPRRPQNVDTRRKLIDDLEVVLIRANNSIVGTVDKYLAVVRSGAVTQALTSIQLQEFSFGEAEAELGAKAAAAVAQEKSRGWLSSEIRDFLRGLIEDDEFIEINGRMYRMKKYAEMVARTTLREAQTEATRDLCQQYENDLVVISDHGCECDVCEEYEGNTYSLSGKSLNYPILEDAPPFHPNCVLPGTRLVSPGGFVAGIRAHYDGETVELTFANSGRLAVTINHMLLTPRGFIPAHLLRKGDDVFYCPSFERIVAGHPYNNGSPSLAENVIHALSVSPGMAISRVPVAAEDVHGDGRFCNGDIDVISANGLLGDTGKALLFEHGLARPFDPGDAQAPMFTGERDFASMLRALATSADSIVGGLRLPSPLINRKAGHLEPLNIGEWAQRGSGLQESTPHDHPVYSKLLCDIAHQKPGLIERDYLVDVQFKSFHGYVYDLHSCSSLYIANGILSSNCKHSMLPTSEAAIAVQSEYGESALRRQIREAEEAAQWRNVR